MSAIKKICAGAMALAVMSTGAFAAPRYATKEAATEEFVKKGAYSCSVIYRSTQSLAVYNGAATMGEILVEPGMPVEAGDTVATYYAPMNDVDIARTELALNQAQDDYEFEIAQRTRVIEEYRAAAEAASNATDARINELLAQKEEIMLSQYDAGAQAQLAALTAQRDAAVASSEPKNVNAGMSGIVAYTSRVDTGTSVNGKELVTLFDPDSMLIWVDNASGELKYGMKVELSLDGNAKANVTGTVVSANNVLPGALQSSAAYVLPDEAPDGIGYTRASVTAQTVSVQDAIVVNNDAIQFSNGKPYVRILTADGVVRTRYVNIGMMGSSETWIILGVEPGDKLITK